MGAAEFGHWLSFLAEEPIGPAEQLPLWAGLMAALHNGPLVRRDKARWSAADFMPRLWAKPAKPKPATAADARAHVAAQRRKLNDAKARNG